MDRILRYQNICSKYNRFCAKNNTFLYFRTEMELGNKEEEMKYFSHFIFKAVFYIMYILASSVDFRFRNCIYFNRRGLKILVYCIAMD